MVNIFIYSRIIILCLISKIITITNNYLFLPFKKFYRIQKANFVPLDDDIFIHDLIKNNIYIPLKVGTPSQTVVSFLNSLEYEFLLRKETCEYPLKSEFITNKSSSFKIEYQNSKKNGGSDISKEIFEFCIDYNKDNLQCNKYKTFQNKFSIYIPPVFDEYEESNSRKIYNKNSDDFYFEIGLSGKSQYFGGNLISFISNIINNKYIKSADWFIYFFNKTNNNIFNDENIDNGILVLGSNPLEYFCDKFDKDNVKNCQGFNIGYDYKSWSIIFQEVKQGKNQKIIDTNIQGVIMYNYNVILGNGKYMENIENTFFNRLIVERKCEKVTGKDKKFIYYSCDKNNIDFKTINDTFPILYFKQTEFEYIFALTAEDLFITVGSKIFFLIVFNKNNLTSSFLLGRIFLEKYFFGFNFNSNKIQFYQEKIKGNDKKIIEQKIFRWYNSAWMIFVIIFLSCLFGLICFLFGRRLYIRRKLKANELDDNFEYEGATKNNKNMELGSYIKM